MEEVDLKEFLGGMELSEMVEGNNPKLKTETTNTLSEINPADIFNEEELKELVITTFITENPLSK